MTRKTYLGHGGTMIDSIIEKLVEMGAFPARKKTKTETIRVVSNMLEAIKYEYNGRLPRWELKTFVTRFANQSKFSERQIYRYINELKALGFLEDIVDVGTQKHYIVLSKRFGSRMLALYRDYNKWLGEV
uniref:Tn2-4p n=2 Tax=Thermococcus nautili TaxID=195522 RepID=D6MXZ8_9EURY|nr:tn2-4p [Thermococcus nautili]